jgi:hypothetical protein
MMKPLHLFGTSAALAALLIFAAAEAAEAQRGGGRGGGGGGGSRQVRSSSGSTMNSASRQTSNVNRSASANRNTNVNRNVNRNTNVNVNRNVNIDNDCCGGGWGDNYHPVARGAAVAATTAVVMGAYYSSLPTGCVTVVRVGVNYSQCGSTWYQPVYSGSNVQYVVVQAP